METPVVTGLKSTELESMSNGDAETYQAPSIA